MRDNPIFVLAFGRCGSTWMQKVLCMHPNIVVWGEHHGLLGPLSTTWHRFVTQENQGQRTNLSAELAQKMIAPLTEPGLSTGWAVPFDREDLLAALRQVVLSLFTARVPASQRWGFKEIRYQDRRVPEFLIRAFPKAQFVLMTREPAPCLRSMVISWFDRNWSSQPAGKLDAFLERRIRALRAQQHAFAQFAADHRDRTTVVAYEDLVRDFRATIERVFAFLQEDLGMIPADTIDAVRSEKTWPTRKDPELEAIIRKRLEATSKH